jgi:L-aspartate oxidase
VRAARFIVIGGGIAGLRAAAALAEHGRVVVLTKTDPAESNTGYAQGGIAAAVGEDDSPALHAADTIRAGDGLCDEDAVRVLTEEGPAYVRELIAWGTEFERDASGGPALGREAAHSVRRVLHAGDATGREIGRVLWQRVRALPSVDVVDHALVTDLIVDEDNGIGGVRYLTSAGERGELRADSTLLATGGAGQLFRETTNPPVATGDGIALAYDAGARVGDLEFVQFHPTALKMAGAPRFLISEALRGDGARLVDAKGRAFMHEYHPDGDLAPRDVVARSIVRESDRTGGTIFLSLAHLDAAYVRSRFPTIAAMCSTVGLDLARDPIPVGPAAHYIMGGVQTDVWGRTSLPRLFAAGEVACTGVHGANRLASNSLLEGLVFGARAAAAMHGGSAAKTAREHALDSATWSVAETPATEQRSGISPQPPLASRQPPLTNNDIRDLMWRFVGLFRSRAGLAEAVARLDAAADRPDASVRSVTVVARLIARAALRREESRGAHFREDFPERDDRRWRRHVVDLK